MNSNSSIKAENLTIEFPVFGHAHRSVRRAVVKATTGGIFGSDNSGLLKTVRAIDNFSFEFSKGDRVGLMGHNGAGKTTLLRVLAGIYAPTTGTLAVSGRITTLLDIGLGLESEASGYENIVLRGIILGLSPSLIKDKMDEIAAFSELGDYLNMPLRTYSSGMLLRLAFSVSVCVPADILIMDEWLSVGDAEFSEKASNKLKSIIDRSSILVLASHSKELIKQTCNRVFVSEHGNFQEVSINSL